MSKHYVVIPVVIKGIERGLLLHVLFETAHPEELQKDIVAHKNGMRPNIEELRTLGLLRSGQMALAAANKILEEKQKHRFKAIGLTKASCHLTDHDDFFEEHDEVYVKGRSAELGITLALLMKITASPPGNMVGIAATGALSTIRKYGPDTEIDEIDGLNIKLDTLLNAKKNNDELYGLTILLIPQKNFINADCTLTNKFEELRENNIQVVPVATLREAAQAVGIVLDDEQAGITDPQQPTLGVFPDTEQSDAGGPVRQPPPESEITTEAGAAKIIWSPIKRLGSKKAGKMSLVAIVPALLALALVGWPLFPDPKSGIALRFESAQGINFTKPFLICASKGPTSYKRPHQNENSLEPVFPVRATMGWRLRVGASPAATASSEPYAVAVAFVGSSSGLSFLPIGPQESLQTQVAPGRVWEWMQQLDGVAEKGVLVFLVKRSGDFDFQGLRKAFNSEFGVTPGVPYNLLSVPDFFNRHNAYNTLSHYFRTAQAPSPCPDIQHMP